MIDVILDDIAMKRVFKDLSSFENKFISKKTTRALRNSLKLGKKYIQSHIRYAVGGNMGGEIANSLYLKVPKKRKRYVVRNMITIRGKSRFFHHTNIINSKYLKKQSNLNASNVDKWSNFRNNYVVHYIPSAIEYGHTYPYNSIVSGGSGKPKTAKPIPGFRNGAKAARQPMIKSMVSELRSEMNKWKSTNT